MNFEKENKPMRDIVISEERYLELIKAECDLEAIKKVISLHDKRYSPIERNTVELLNSMYCKEADNGNK